MTTAARRELLEAIQRRDQLVCHLDRVAIQIEVVHAMGEDTKQFEDNWLKLMADYDQLINLIRHMEEAKQQGEPQ